MTKFTLVREERVSNDAHTTASLVSIINKFRPDGVVRAELSVDTEYNDEGYNNLKGVRLLYFTPGNDPIAPVPYDNYLMSGQHALAELIETRYNTGGYGLTDPGIKLIFGEDNG